MGVDRCRVVEVYAAGPDEEGSASGYRVGERLTLTARHAIAPAWDTPAGRVLVRPVTAPEWLPANVVWQDEDRDAALLRIEPADWAAPAEEAVLRWGKLTGTDPAECAAVGFPWASVRPDHMRDTAHVYGQVAPLGQLKKRRLDVDITSASPTARAGKSSWAGLSGAGLVVDSHLVGVIVVDPARYQDRLVALPVSELLADPRFRAVLAAHAVPMTLTGVGGSWWLRLPGGSALSLLPPYRALSRRFRPDLPTLLRPEHGLVPFLGREQQLEKLTGWCADPAGPPLLVLFGAGGTGKTRLAAETCVRMLMNGWDVGFAAGRRDGESRSRLERRTLVVIDDADRRPELIGDLVTYLREDDSGPPVRLLVVARGLGAWWQRLVRQHELAHNFGQLPLDQAPIALDRRAEHFTQAAAAFAPHLHPESAAVPAPPGLNDPAFDDPLLIHIAALLALHHDLDPASSPAPRDTRTRLLRGLCERERMRWQQLGDALALDPDSSLADQVVALATLTVPPDEATASALLSAIPEQDEVDRIGRGRLTHWAHRLYPGDGYWNPLRPDLLAEQHLADTAQLAELVLAAVAKLEDHPDEVAYLERLLAELTRCASPQQPVVVEALHQTLHRRLPRLVDLAISHPQGALPQLVSTALTQTPQPDHAEALANRMPKSDIFLADLAATLAAQQVEHCRTRADFTSEERNDLAGSLNNQSVRLAELGRREDALAAIEEAVGIRRELAAARPAAFTPDLASSLNNLSNRLSDLGRREDALAAIDEAVGYYRELAAARPAAFTPDLASSLNNLSLRLSDLGRREDALAAIEEAVGIRRELAAARPAAFTPDLASSLNNLSNRLSDLGRREDALAAIDEAVGYYRELAAARPAAFTPDLASSLNNLSLRLSDLGRREDALAAIEEAVGIRRELAAARPAAFTPDLASSLNNQAVQLSGLGRREDALAAIDEAVGYYRELAAARPAAFTPDLAGSLNNLSLRLSDLGRREDALAAIEEAVGIHRELAAARPAAFTPDLAGSLNNQAVQLSGLGRREDALAAIEEAVGIHRELAAARPAAFTPDLAGSLHNQAVQLAELGRREDALAAIEEAVGIRRELAAARPAAFTPDLAGSLHNLSNRLAELGRREDALAAIDEAVGIRRELAAARPAAFTPDLGHALTVLGIRLTELRRHPEALVADREALLLYRQLYAGDPDRFTEPTQNALTNLTIDLRDLGRSEQDIRHELDQLLASGEAD